MEGRRMIMIIGPKAGVIRSPGDIDEPLPEIRRPVPPPMGGSGSGLGPIRKPHS